VTAEPFIFDLALRTRFLKPNKIGGILMKKSDPNSEKMIFLKAQAFTGL